MPYYPLSQIKTNLYTNGNGFVTNVNNPDTIYKGYYWKTSSGKYFTGKTPQDKPNTELFLKQQINFNQYSDIAINLILNSIATNGGSEINGGDNIEGGNPTVLDYIALKNIPKGTVQFIPYYNPQIPTQQNYQNGEFRRFFCKKTNEIIYIEIDVTQYNKLISKNPEILWQLYLPYNITWQLTGDKQQVAKVNKNMVELASKNLKLPSFNLYIKEDYTKYYQYTEASNLYTAGGEFKTEKGVNYVGFYHIHNSKGPMVGKIHTIEPHGYLFPINENIISRIQTLTPSSISGSNTTPTYTPNNTNIGGGGGGGGGY